MVHRARQKGESGFYHIVTKGDGNQIIFEDESDRLKYVTLLETAVSEQPVRLHAYCLMSNHVHLLLEDMKHDGSFSAFMKQVNEMHAMHFRQKTGRVGHVFKSRFWSEPIETDQYFLSALRYIHTNPEPAGICQAKDYRWSSYRAHCGAVSFVETELTRSLLGSIRAFEDFSASGCKYAVPFPGSKLRRHLSPDELSVVAVKLLGRETLVTLRQQKRQQCESAIAKLSLAGFTESEIVRVTGLGRQVVRTALASRNG